MIRNVLFATAMLGLVGSLSPVCAQDRVSSGDANGNLDALIATHAAAHGVPESLVRRVIRRESRGNARAISAGNYGLMQIRLGTARAMGYRGTAAGLLDANTNMTYAVKYLAGAYRAAGGNADRAVHYYAAGYYHAGQRKGTTETASARSGLSTFALAAPIAPNQ
jgi:soluble lytic murein transglycosylase-like protein